MTSLKRSPSAKAADGSSGGIYLRGDLRRSPLPWLGALLCIYLLGPIVAQLVRAGSSRLSTLAVPGLGSALGVSILTATISTAIICLFGVPLAWTLSNARRRAWVLVGIAVQLPLALPPLMSGILLVELVGPYSVIGRLFGGRLTTTLAGIILAQTFVSSPFLVIAARSAFDRVDPELVAVAATLGQRSWSRFWRVSLPLAGPGIRSGLLLTWLRAFGEFGATTILAYHPYSLPVFTFVQFGQTGLPQTLGPTGAGVMAAVVVLGIAYGRPGRGLWRWAAGSALRDRSACSARPVAGAVASASSGTRRNAPVTLEFDIHDHLGNFDLRIAHHAGAPRIALLGPSGAGKSLTLRCLAGLRGPDVGQVRLGEHDIGGLDPEDRRVGWVPQDAALFPQLSVWRQLTFAGGSDLHLAAYWLEHLGLDGLEGRLPHQLSGGQRQRVALARALARAPDLLLLDEPFSSLDRPIRDELRRELRRLQVEVGVATVLVTHDPEEAAILADEIVVIDRGRALQAGTRQAVFGQPASDHVARLLGIQNLSNGVITSRRRMRAGGCVLSVPDTKLPAGSLVTWCIRAERLILSPGQPGSASAGTYRARVLDTLDLGSRQEVGVELDGGLKLTATTLGASYLASGQFCSVEVPPDAITLWPAKPPRARPDSLATHP